MKSRQIVAAGGGLHVETGEAKLERYVLEVSGAAKPRACLVPTASGDDPALVARFFETHARFGIPLGVLRFFRRTPRDLREMLFAYDVVYVGGGNTASMLAVWRHWGFDTVLREAWERGIVLAGSSAGSLCWFASGVTDSFAGELEPMRCLGFLAGSHCPHYDGEKQRRPAYRRMIANGALEAGFACDDGAALHFVDDALSTAVAGLPDARAYRVERAGDGSARETVCDARVL